MPSPKTKAGLRIGLPHGRVHTLGLLLAGCLLISACSERSRERPVVVLQGATMGTGYSVKVVASGVGAALLQQGIQQRLDRLEALMSTYRTESEISRFNRSRSTGWFPVSAETATVVREALRISRLTRGAFDITVAPLVDLWGFGPASGEDRVPSDQRIRLLLKTVGWERLQARAVPPALRKEWGDLHLDLSGIAKGYAVDRVAEYLDERGEKDYLVEIGGEVRTRGLNARDRPWAIAIERPDAGMRAVQEIMQLQNEGLATSGDYRNFFEQDGQRFSHTIDPRSGRPVTHGLASVTVVAPAVMRADALATALMVMGPERGEVFAEREGIGAFFISHGPEGWQETSTSAFQGRLISPDHSSR